MLEIKPSEQKVKKISPKNLVSKIVCEPNLGKRNLYPTISQKEFHEKDTKLRMDVLAYANGQNSIFDIAIKLNKKLKAINEEIKLLKKANLIS